MEFSKQLIKEMLGNYLQTTFSQVLPEIIKESLKNSDLLIAQDFVCLEEATSRFHLCRKTLYNYHNKGYITLHSSEGKTFVSIRELEAHIRKHPLPRNLGVKMAA
jgi:ACT domain-containing protein